MEMLISSSENLIYNNTPKNCPDMNTKVKRNLSVENYGKIEGGHLGFRAWTRSGKIYREKSGEDLSTALISSGEKELSQCKSVSVSLIELYNNDILVSHIEFTTLT